MSTLLDDSADPPDHGAGVHACAPRWPPGRFSIPVVRHSPQGLTAEQKAAAAEPFNAEATFPLRRQKTARQCRAEPSRLSPPCAARPSPYWIAHQVFLPYPEPGIQLIGQDKIDVFIGQDAIASGRIG